MFEGDAVVLAYGSDAQAEIGLRSVGGCGQLEQCALERAERAEAPRPDQEIRPRARVELLEQGRISERIRPRFVSRFDVSIR